LAKSSGKPKRGGGGKGRRDPAAAFSPRIIEDQSELDAFCEALAAGKRFAFDAEFVAEGSYDAIVCLVQVATDDGVWLIDPMLGYEISGFWELISDDRIEKVVHAGLEDFGLSYLCTGKTPRNVFDVQIAAGLVDVDYPLSLQRLVRSVMGVRLGKSQTLTDWRQRPLSAKQIQYAVDDVAYLLPIHDGLRENLEKRGRTEWAQEEFKRFNFPELYRQQDEELFRKVKGIGGLDAEALAITREIAIERERMAQQFNRPPRAFLKDYLLVAIAKHGWHRHGDLGALRGFQLTGNALRQISEAVKRGLATPEADRPQPAEVVEETADEILLAKFLSAVLHDFCQRERIASGLLATNKDIRALILSHTRPGANHALARALQRGWRKEAVGALLDDVLNGVVALRVDRDGRKFRLQALRDGEVEGGWDH
jgi:ribonuclease D